MTTLVSPRPPLGDMSHKLARQASFMYTYKPTDVPHRLGHGRPRPVRHHRYSILDTRYSAWRGWRGEHAACSRGTQVHISCGHRGRGSKKETASLGSRCQMTSRPRGCSGGVFSLLLCVASGGTWRGGTDVSGQIVPEHGCMGPLPLRPTFCFVVAVPSEGNPPLEWPETWSPPPA